MISLRAAVATFLYGPDAGRRQTEREEEARERAARPYELAELPIDTDFWRDAPELRPAAEARS